MTPSRRDWLLWSCALAASLVLLMATSASRAQTLPPRPAGARPHAVASSFEDFGHQRHSISCSIGEKEHRREMASIGFTARQRAEWLSGKMYQRALRELADVNEAIAIFGCSANVFPSGGIPPGKDWSITPALSCSGHEGFTDAANDYVMKWLARLDGEKDRVLEEFYRDHSIRVVNTKRSRNDTKNFYIDYVPVVRRATPIVARCARALFEEGGKSLNADLFTSFLQQLTYVELKNPPGEFHVHDFLVPSQVLVDGKGDCDSKAAAFCSLWRSYSKDAILLISDRHTLVGFKAPPNSPRDKMRIKGIDYIACDVSGVYKAPCGDVPRDDYRPVFLGP